MKLRLLGALCAFLLTIAATSATASLFTYKGTIVITDNDGATEMLVGDRFDFLFTYDDSAATDADPDTIFGRFQNPLTDLQLTRESANTGTWDPAGGSFTLPSIIHTNVTPTGRFRPSALGTGFPDLDGIPFSELAFDFGGGTVTDTGSGQTLSDQIGGPFNPSLFPTQEAFLIWDDFTFPLFEGSFFIRADVENLSQVPIPPAFYLFTSGLIGLIGIGRKRKTTNMEQQS